MPLDEAISIAIMIGACVAFYAIRSVVRGKLKETDISE
jgi:hypothetical protein